MRLFVALSLPPALRAQVASLVEPLRSRFAFTWARSEYHLTLVFLGETVPARVDAVKAVLDSTSMHHAAFSVRLAGAGTFGRPSSPRVLWLGVEGELAVARALQAELALALDAVDPNQPDWSPHLTVARAKPRNGDPRLLEAAELLTATKFEELCLREVTLFESRGGRFFELHRALLTG